MVTDKAQLFETKVTRQPLSEQVASRIQNLIVSGQLQVDDRLPSSHELAQRMGVSRTVIREAVKRLEEKGLVRTIAGSGTYASKVDARSVSESFSLLIQQRGSSFEHFYELRRIVEVGIVEHFVQADLEFHTLLARATHNPLLLAVHQLVPEQLVGFIGLTTHAEGAVETAIVHHRAMLEALKSGDVGACQQQMREHIDTGMSQLNQMNR
jgi:DNA-binding FadR family transcriptional regulator